MKNKKNYRKKNENEKDAGGCIVDDFGLVFNLNGLNLRTFVFLRYLNNNLICGKYRPCWIHSGSIMVLASIIMMNDDP